ncbi:unnamed protein product [Onchocerca flexuosa]|uniref:Crinkler (CRN) family protein n=1 Tax=Onchocerca flexuosa TaxID=387005 RepID=A0A183HTP5_9BILA|nr:unnamed protein product [Onchocerca flexuosa]
MAAMDALMRCWGVAADKKFPFDELDSLNDLDHFNKPHYSLQDICGPSFVLKFVDLEEEQEPINVKEVALRYKKEIEAVVSNERFCLFADNSFFFLNWNKFWAHYGCWHSIATTIAA